MIMSNVKKVLEKPFRSIHQESFFHANAIIKFSFQPSVKHLFLFLTKEFNISGDLSKTRISPKWGDLMFKQLSCDGRTFNRLGHWYIFFFKEKNPEKSLSKQDRVYLARESTNENTFLISEQIQRIAFCLSQDITNIKLCQCHYKNFHFKYVNSVRKKSQFQKKCLIEKQIK